MKDIIFILICGVFSSCMQTGYQTPYIISDTTKEPNEPNTEQIMDRIK